VSASTRVPLAWKNLTHDRRKLAVAIAGIAFAVMLMFQQRGFNHALFDSTVELVKHLDGDLVILSQARFSLSAELRFPREVLDVVQASPFVESANGVYLENVSASLRAPGRRSLPIRVIAFDLNQPIYLDPDTRLAGLRPRLSQPGTALIDRFSKTNFGVDLSSDFARPQSVELANRQLDIVGTFSLGRDFANDGNLIMSLENFRAYFPFRHSDPTGLVDLGIVRCRPGVSLDAARRDVEARLPQEAVALVRDEYIRREIRFWARNTPIGVIFAVGSVMGFVVGVIICYQVLATDIADHLSEFATLKAMGYTSRYFFQLVIRQSLYLSFLGFAIGLALSLLLFRYIEAVTGLLMVMTWGRALVILGLTIAMCVLSGLLALRKLILADPASLFT
jgi:putative ABC transport system permease protein